MGMQEGLPSDVAPQFKRTEIPGILAPKQGELVGIMDLVSSVDQLESRRKFESLSLVAQGCFSPDLNDRVIPRVNHTSNPDPEYFVPALKYFTEYNGDPRLEELFWSNGQWRHKERGNPLLLDKANLVSYLRGGNRLINDYCETSPDAHSEDGYNRHGDEHVKRVVADTEELLYIAGASQDAVKRGIFAAGVHDIGYMFGKEAHSLISANMIPIIYPDMIDSEVIEIDKRARTELDIIQRIVANHDSDVLRVNMARWGRMPVEERLQAMTRLLRPEGLALLIADKKDIGRDRISWSVRDHGIKKDEHAEENFLVHNEAFGDFGDTILWKLKFDPEIRERDKKKYPNWAVKLSEQMNNGHYRTNFQRGINLFWDIYTERAITLVEATLALFPNKKAVEIRFSDNYGETSSQTFEKADLQQDINRAREINSRRSGAVRR